MVNTRHDAPMPKARFVGISRVLRRRMEREGLIPKRAKRRFPEGFHPTKGWRLPERKRDWDKLAKFYTGAGLTRGTGLTIWKGRGER